MESLKRNLRFLGACLVIIVAVAALAAWLNANQPQAAPTTPHTDVVGGNLEWTPERSSDSSTTPPCVDRKVIGSAYADLTASAKDDVTYVDLQVPQNLRGLTGLQVGADYVPVPDFLFQAHVSTVVLGNQFPNRFEIYSCWG